MYLSLLIFGLSALLTNSLCLGFNQENINILHFPQNTSSLPLSGNWQIIPDKIIDIQQAVASSHSSIANLERAFSQTETMATYRYKFKNLLPNTVYSIGVRSEVPIEVQLVNLTDNVSLGLQGLGPLARSTEHLIPKRGIIAYEFSNPSMDTVWMLQVTRASFNLKTPPLYVPTLYRGTKAVRNRTLSLALDWLNLGVMVLISAYLLIVSGKYQRSKIALYLGLTSCVLIFRVIAVSSWIHSWIPHSIWLSPILYKIEYATMLLAVWTYSSYLRHMFTEAHSPILYRICSSILGLAIGSIIILPTVTMINLLPLYQVALLAGNLVYIVPSISIALYKRLSYSRLIFWAIITVFCDIMFLN